ncbi:MAG: alpha/beta hydrolase [Novosphingobium sp.]|nr:alpha/beta hydrolase [Novosphingobium sp.]
MSRRTSQLCSEAARRLALALEPRPKGVSGPPPTLLVGELRDLALPPGAPPGVAPARNPQPVMLLPGFFTGPSRMKPLARALRAAGHQVEDWGLGFNLGPTPENFAFLLRRVAALSRAYGAPLALVGWSLGGLFAREIARRQPEHVSRVITMGTPFSGDPRANNAWRAYQAIAGHPVDQPPIDCELAAKPPVLTIALWSPRDGVIRPRSAAGWPAERDRAIALRCTHLGFPRRPEAIAEVLRQLDWQD